MARTIFRTVFWRAMDKAVRMPSCAAIVGCEHRRSSSRRSPLVPKRKQPPCVTWWWWWWCCCRRRRSCRRRFGEVGRQMQLIGSRGSGQNHNRQSVCSHFALVSVRQQDVVIRRPCPAEVLANDRSDLGCSTPPVSSTRISTHTHTNQPAQHT